MSLRGLQTRLAAQAGTGAGTVVLWVGGFCLASWIFFGVVDWIVDTKEARWAEHEYRSQSQMQRPFKVQERPSTQITY